MGVFDTVKKQISNLVGITATGQATKANSLPVVLASDQGDLPVTLDGESVAVSSLPALAAGTNNIGDVDVASLPALAAGTNNIGDVDVASIAAGETHVGSVAGETVHKTATFTRPANTTAYAAGDVICDSTSAPSDLTVEAARVNGGGGIITDVLLVDSANQSTDPQLELWLFTASPTRSNDNAALALADADLGNLVGVVTVAEFGTAFVGNTASGASGNLAFHAKGLNIGFRCAAGEKTLHWLLVARNAYTPVSGEKFTVVLKTVE